MDHPIVHFEIAADDPEALAGFYTELLGWKLEPMAGPNDYWEITTSSAEGALGGGMMRRQHPQQGPVNYVLVESADQYLTRASELGATIVLGKQEIPGIGWFGVITDPQGNPLGLFEMKGE